MEVGAFQGGLSYYCLTRSNLWESPRQSRGFTCDNYSQELWYRYVPDAGNWHGGTCTHWTMALSAATHPETETVKSALKRLVERIHVELS